MNDFFTYTAAETNYLKSRFGVISMNACGFNCQHNMTNGDLDNRKYMGTYFVRTVAEHLRMTEELFQNSVLKESILKRKSLKILDWCAGQGGASYGLLRHLTDCGYDGSVKVVAFDANEYALNSLETLFEDYRQNHAEIDLSLEIVQGEAISNWDSFFNGLEIGTFDFVLTSKAIGEIIKNTKGKYINMYRSFLLQVIPLLKADGICLMTDVNVPNHGHWQGELMEKQIVQVIKGLRGRYGIVTSNEKLDGFCHHEIFETHFNGHTYNDKLCYYTIANEQFMKKFSYAWN